MTDADVDGSHITTLIMTFFFRYMQDLIRNGIHYILQLRLFTLLKKVKQNATAGLRRNVKLQLLRWDKEKNHRLVFRDIKVLVR